jgi:hypothetical protein
MNLCSLSCECSPLDPISAQTRSSGTSLLPRPLPRPSTSSPLPTHLPLSPVVPCGVRMQAHCCPVTCCSMRLQAPFPTHLPPPLPSSQHTLMLTHLAGITDNGTCQNALRLAARTVVIILLSTWSIALLPPPTRTLTRSGVCSGVQDQAQHVQHQDWNISAWSLR